MKKVGVLYWSGGGNTTKMAEAILEGVKEAGAEGEMHKSTEFSGEAKDYDAVAFGCSAAGSDQLEAFLFEPFWNRSKVEMGDKKVALFGSYGWSTDWMDRWSKDAEVTEVNVIETVICKAEPDEEALKACKELGKKLAE